MQRTDRAAGHIFRPECVGSAVAAAGSSPTHGSRGRHCDGKQGRSRHITDACTWGNLGSPAGCQGGQQGGPAWLRSMKSDGRSLLHQPSPPCVPRARVARRRPRHAPQPGRLRGTRPTPRASRQRPPRPPRPLPAPVGGGESGVRPPSLGAAAPRLSVQGFWGREPLMQAGVVHGAEQGQGQQDEIRAVPRSRSASSRG